MHAQCIVCGDTIGLYLHGDKIFLEDDSWKQAYGELWMKASEIENKYFMKDENHWDTLYRLGTYVDHRIPYIVLITEQIAKLSTTQQPIPIV